MSRSDFSFALINAISQLATTGEVSCDTLTEIVTEEAVRLWAISTDGKRAVATPALATLIKTLPTLPEAIAAILSCDPNIRQAWQQIVCARLKAAGQQRDTTGLCEAISTLGPCATAILEKLPQAKLSPTAYSALERSVFGVPAEQAIATPKLYRILGATAPLVEAQQREGKQQPPNPPLPNVHPQDPSKNWLQGRLIQLPNPETTQEPAAKPWLPTSILSGNWADYSPPNAEISPEIATMYWVLSRPWCFLLAQATFTQEAWAAERISGELILELDPSNESLAHRPPKITVVVVSANGEETLCGSLSELLLRVLQQLGISLLTPPATNLPETLDAQLAPVIAALLQRQVWQFSPGTGGYRPYYTIHPTFSDSCYRALGSKYFNRLASHITATIRGTSEQWAKECQITAQQRSTSHPQLISTP